MVNPSEKGSVQRDLRVVEHRMLTPDRAGVRFLPRLIGVLSVILVTCGSAFGQFMVQPMRINVGTYPGRRTVTAFTIENQNADSETSVDLRLLDVTQDSSGMWQTIEPDAEVVEDPNGARWVNVGTEYQPIRVDISRMRSCVDWLRLEKDVVDLPPLRRETLNLWVRVPTGKQGYYCAALVAQTRIAVDDETGVRAPVILQFLIPVIVNVQGRAPRDEVKLVDAGLAFRPASDIHPAATLVTLGVDNDGPTYVRMVGVTRVYGERGGHWQRITEMQYPDTGIIPGVKINLQQDIGRQLPSGKYRLEGALYINGRRADRIQREIDFSGDERVRDFDLEVALDLNPREVPIDVMPGATRTTIMQVANTSQSPVTVDAALLLPDHMTDRAIVNAEGNSVRGQDFGCVDWVTIQPTQFRLRGYGRQNLRIVARMPRLTDPLPHYYSTVRLRATYDSGEMAGTTEGLVYLNSRGVEGTPNVQCTQPLSISESGPSRYVVTARFSNLGDTHVQPRCRLLLTQVAAGAAGMTWRNIEMSSATFNQRGNMLPLERRTFTEILDVASVPPGTYYLTAVLQYAGGATAQRQEAIRITEEGGRKVVELISLDNVGGPTQIQL